MATSVGIAVKCFQWGHWKQYPKGTEYASWQNFFEKRCGTENRRSSDHSSDIARWKINWHWLIREVRESETLPACCSVTAPGQMGHVGGRFFVTTWGLQLFWEPWLRSWGLEWGILTNSSILLCPLRFLTFDFVFLFCVIRFAGGNLPVLDVLFFFFKNRCMLNLKLIFHLWTHQGGVLRSAIFHEEIFDGTGCWEDARFVDFFFQKNTTKRITNDRPFQRKSTGKKRNKFWMFKYVKRHVRSTLEWSKIIEDYDKQTGFCGFLPVILDEDCVLPAVLVNQFCQRFQWCFGRLSLVPRLMKQLSCALSTSKAVILSDSRALSLLRSIRCDSTNVRKSWKIHGFSSIFSEWDECW